MKKEELKYHPMVQEGYDEEGNVIEHPYCIDDFIKDLQKISPDKRKLPLGCFTPNGFFWRPKAYMVFDEDHPFDENGPIAMAINYEKKNV